MPLLAAVASMLGLAPVLSPMGGLHAAELKVLAGGSLTSVLNELGPQFERASGHKLVIHFNSTPNLIKQATRRAVRPRVSFPSMFSGTPPRRPASRPARPSISRASAMASRCARARPSPTSAHRMHSRRPCSTRSPSPSCRRAPPAPISLKVFERLGIGEAMKAKTIRADRTGADRPGRRQGRRRTRGVCRQRADRSRRRTGRSISRRIAAGAGFLGGRRGRYQGGGSRQGVHRLPHHPRCRFRHQGQGHEPWLSGEWEVPFGVATSHHGTSNSRTALETLTC